jgi:oligopeptide transport system substrate-binding protein
VQQAGVEEDFTKSMELYQQAEQMLVDDDAILPLWFMESYILVKPYVEGYELNALGYVMFNEVSIKEH